MTTAAAIDGLVYHGVILELDIPSYRMKYAKIDKRMIGFLNGQEIEAA